jgi:hypothetical protein
MKKVVTTITAAVFALGLAGGALAQTATTPEKPAVKTEAPASSSTVAPKEAAKPEKPAVPEAAKSGATKEVKTADQGKTKKEAKKAAKKGKSDKKPVVVEPTKPETK